MATSKKKPSGDDQWLKENDQALLDWMRADESFKMKVRVYRNGDADIETDTLEEAKEARAIVEEYKKNNSGTVQLAMQALPTS